MTGALILLLPIIAYASAILFLQCGWFTFNYEHKKIPYSLGVLVVFCLLGFLLAFQRETTVLTTMSVIYIIGVWFIGLIDDIFGAKKTKGLKGHFLHFIRHGKISTGLLKVGGTVGLAFAYLLTLQPQSLEEWVRTGIILILTPHIMNLFDTRPLRVWKISFVYSLFFVSVFAAMPFTFYLYLLTYFFVHYVLEGHKVAMLGDNGATALGAILAVLTASYAPIQYQWYVILLFCTLTLLAEKVSFSRWIEQSPILRRIDSWGVYSSK
ncbi:hypothetical protein [Alkalihalobacillus sp. LMS39]|uniref:hypothetical protein n=1 Tax=Alkalihalobacillus sp. LMS39 TaxID=2924032 RepID=UPI001FB3D301|nr:hypothetical protein [Alkalihalobacillus sp. LMS39]UOE95944.1 hypothetical protein MM271_10230 [Alkalihalobacillus sp. LMS39]